MTTALAALERSLPTQFVQRGAVMMDVPILQPSDPYLDTAGEALRRRIFLTKGEDGRGLCLRPDFTIPVCLAHIAQGAGLPRRYAYCGTIFRQSGDGPSEYPQAGIEDLGDTDLAAADGRTIADALGVLADCGIDLTIVETTVGDQALFEQFLSSLGLPSGWQRRLIRTFGHDTLLRQALESLATGGSRASIDSLSPDLYELALARDLAKLSENVRDRMEEGGLPLHRGRTPAEIAGRLIEKVAVAETRLDRTVLERLRAFLSIDCPLDRSVDALEMLCRESGTDLGHSLDAFKARGEALARAGVDLSGLRYRAAFGRALDYYTGMVFEVSAKGQDGPLVGGGRYDRLVSYLGARETIPAVGFALWPGRMASVASGVRA
ncbi:ATP phosphoribosyltransferase regulatory subunit [Aureimonas altamirensis]|uniref:ATP phosphoribosyltransferase regulatory subunit n=1 Tax=Aureimonas altamirensis TaxID=370622 RepID=UPI001E2C4654|nr:ATP phosphoribosyltransferase regulatory subunit [Aureimonas altamirensis]UHD47041.1 ATP phosphoribosyltransferase regulatory subunit [Aureimonas altamirensis]